ncbi:hypothetical protein MKX03_015619 [Papaver bracteatum]|nr:hypothetical protein MKX03_015619 [Papaver bracteatum]
MMANIPNFKAQQEVLLNYQSFRTLSPDSMKGEMRRAHGIGLDFPIKVAIQLNDTHPTLAVPELMRLLMDI